MDDVSVLVFGDLFGVVVIISVDDSLPVNMLSKAVGVIRHRQVLDVWLLLTKSFCLQAVPISDNECFHYRNAVNAFCAPTCDAGLSHLRCGRSIVDWGATISTFGDLVHFSHMANVEAQGRAACGASLGAQC